MTSLILFLSPFIVTALTGWIKGMAPFASLTDTLRKPAVRILAYLASILYVLLGAWITGNVDNSALTYGVDGLLTSTGVFLSSLGVFHAFFQKAPTVPTLPGSGTTLNK